MGAICVSKNDNRIHGRNNKLNDEHIKNLVTETLKSQKKEESKDTQDIKDNKARLVNVNNQGILNNTLSKSNLLKNFKTNEVLNQTLSIIDLISRKANKDSLNKLNNIYNLFINPQVFDINEVVENNVNNKESAIVINKDKVIEKVNDKADEKANEKIDNINDVEDEDEELLPIGFNFYNENICDVEFFAPNNEAIEEKENLNIDIDGVHPGNPLSEIENENLSDKVIGKNVLKQSGSNLSKNQGKDLPNSKNLTESKKFNDNTPLETLKSSTSETKIKILKDKEKTIEKNNDYDSDKLKDYLERNQTDPTKLDSKYSKGTASVSASMSVSKAAVAQKEFKQGKKNSKSSKKDVLVSNPITNPPTTEKLRKSSTIRNQFRTSKDNLGSLFRDPNLDFDFEKHVYQESDKIKSKQLNKINSTGNLGQVIVNSSVSNSNPNGNKGNINSINKNYKEYKDLFLAGNAGKSNNNTNNINIKAKSQLNKKEDPIPVYKPVPVQPYKFTTSNTLGRITLAKQVSNNTSLLSKNLNKSKHSNLPTSRTNFKGKTTVVYDKQPLANIKINLKDLIKENVKENYYENNRYGNLQNNNISTIAKNKSYVSPNLNTFQDCIDKFTFTEKSNIYKKSSNKGNSPNQSNRSERNDSGKNNRTYKTLIKIQ